MLGLVSGASFLDIDDAYEASRSRAASRLDSAPTDALKAKYKQTLDRLDEAYEALTSGASGSSGFADSPLSQTKMADLPGADPSFTSMGNAGSVTPQSMGLQAGAVLNDRYEVVRLIGQGGMGAVYESRDRIKDEAIAIKVLLPGLVSSDQARERFLAEAKISCKLSHPNIVNVFDVQQSGPHHFLTMELLEGQTLRERIEVQKVARSEFSIEEVQDIARQVGDALNYAHTHMVHRDLKPENIFLCEDGTVKVMDFGIVRLLTSTELTKTGMALGTAYYMAPEQLTGAKSVDARADQYSLCVMLYELLSGQLPMGAVAPIGDIRLDIPKPMAKAIMKAISPRPEDRFPALNGLIDALESKNSFSVLGSLRSRSSLHPNESGSGEQAGNYLARLRSKRIAASVAVIIVLAMVVFVYQIKTWDGMRPVFAAEYQDVRNQFLSLKGQAAGNISSIEAFDSSRLESPVLSGYSFIELSGLHESLVAQNPQLVKRKREYETGLAYVRRQNYFAAIEVLRPATEMFGEFAGLQEVMLDVNQANRYLGLAMRDKAYASGVPNSLNTEKVRDIWKKITSIVPSLMDASELTTTLEEVKNLIEKDTAVYQMWAPSRPGSSAKSQASEPLSNRNLPKKVGGREPAAVMRKRITNVLRLGMHHLEDTSDRAFKTLTSRDVVEVIEKRSSFSLVEDNSGTQGWVKTAYLVEGPGNTATVTSSLRLGLHRADDTSDRPFKMLNSNDRVVVIEINKNYAHIRDIDGDEGWVKAAYLMDDMSEAIRVEILFSGDCWTEITDSNGDRLFFDLGRAGQIIDVAGQAPLTLLLADVSNAKLTVNRESFLIPNSSRSGKIARFTLDNN